MRFLAPKNKKKTKFGRPLVVVEKITTRRREGVGVIVEKKKKVFVISRIYLNGF